MGLTDLLKTKKRKEQEQAAVERIAAVAEMEVDDLLKHLPASLVYEREAVLENICENSKGGESVDIPRILEGLSKTQRLLRKNLRGLVALVNKYREHTWGLLDAFGNSAVRIEKKKKYRPIIQAVRANAGDDAGLAFQCLKVPVMRKYGDLLIHGTRSAGENTSTMFDHMNGFFEDYRNRRTTRRVTGLSAIVGIALCAAMGIAYSYKDGKSTYKEAWEAFKDDVSAISHEVRDVGDIVNPSSSVPYVGGEKEDPHSYVIPRVLPSKNIGINARVSGTGVFEFDTAFTSIPRTPEKRYGLELYEGDELVFNSFSVEDDCNETSSSDTKTTFECRDGEVKGSFRVEPTNDYTDTFSVSVSYSVSHTDPGQHTYFFRLSDRHQALASDAVTLTFIGETQDYRPAVSLSFCDKEDTKSEDSACDRVGDLGMKVFDEGDNPDFDRVEVFLNNEKIGISEIEGERSIGGVRLIGLATYDTSGLTLKPGDEFTAVVYDGSGQKGKSYPLEVTVASEVSTDDVSRLAVADAEKTVDDAQLPVIVSSELFHDAERSSRELGEPTPAEETGIFNGYSTGITYARRSLQEYDDLIGEYADETFFEATSVKAALKSNNKDVFYRRNTGDVTMNARFYTNPNPNKEKIEFTFSDGESDHTFTYFVFQDGRMGKEIVRDGEGNRVNRSDADITNQHLAAIFQYFVNSEEVLANVPVVEEAPTPGPIE